MAEQRNESAEATRKMVEEAKVVAAHPEFYESTIKQWACAMTAATADRLSRLLVDAADTLIVRASKGEIAPEAMAERWEQLRERIANCTYPRPDGSCSSVRCSCSERVRDARYG